MRDIVVLEGLGLDGRIILKWVTNKWDRDMEWIDLAQDKYRWQAIVNAKINNQIQ